MFLTVVILYGKQHSAIHCLQKKALKILLNLTDMFLIAVWRFYNKLMNGKLPKCFVD